MTLSYIESLKVFNLSSLDNVDEQQIRKIYHTLAKKYHPDKGGNAEDFIKLREAYAVLKEALINPSKRRTEPEFASSSSTTGSTYSTSSSYRVDQYKEAYEKLLKQIRDYERIINNEVLIINRTSQSVNSQIDGYNKAHQSLKSWLDKSLADLEEKNRTRWWEIVVPRQRMDQNQYIMAYNKIIEQYNSQSRKLNDDFNSQMISTYQNSFNMFIDMLKEA